MPYGLRGKERKDHLAFQARRFTKKPIQPLQAKPAEQLGSSFYGPGQDVQGSTNSLADFNGMQLISIFGNPKLLFG